jgi:hypothetical protein
MAGIFDALPHNLRLNSSPHLIADHARRASDEDLRTKHARICLSRASQNDLSWPLDSLGSVRARFAFTWMKGGVEAAAGGSLLGTSAAAVVAQSSSTIFHFMPAEGNVASFTEITRNWECPMCGLRCTHFAVRGPNCTTLSVRGVFCKYTVAFFFTRFFSLHFQKFYTYLFYTVARASLLNLCFCHLT